jgi:Pentapeptide repeats (8 copies)
MTPPCAWCPWLARATRAGIDFAVAAVAVLAVIALFGPITDLIARHDASARQRPQRAAHLQSARETARTQLLTLGAGIFVAGALWFTARNLFLSREGQVTDRYTKAIEQLGADKLDVRIGGIYALERVVRDSARDHPTVMEVLGAFVREHSPEPWLPPADDEEGAEATNTATRPDVQAAITVIGRRNPRHDGRPVNLAGSNLTAADLHSADLRGADLPWLEPHRRAT